jgi:predicted lactoylglutathione lyase
MLDSSNVLFKPENQSSVVKPYLLSHGTLECRSLKESRRFYEEFLGLECVRHAQQAMHARCGIKFSIVCVEVGGDVKPMSVLNHWGLEVDSREQVEHAYKSALAMKDKYKIGKITEPSMRHGIYSFYLEDLDGNYWEIEYYDGSVHEDAFDFGDRFSMDD